MYKALVIAAMVLLPSFTWAQGEVVSGRYIHGHEAHSFTPCGGPDYWVKADDKVLVDLERFYHSKTTEPYQAIFVELKGQLVDEERTGFAADYDGLFLIELVMNYQLDLPAGCE